MKDKNGFMSVVTQTCHSEGTKVTEESIACHCEEQPNNSFLPFIRGGLRRGDSSFETPIIKVFQKKKKDITSSPALPLKEGKGATAFTLAETQKNISLATFRGRGIKGEGATKRAAFTLAETLIVLVILGIVASITIPAIVRRQMEAQNRAKIKKSMTVFDTAINKIVIENQLKSDRAVQDWAGENCENSINYFKVNSFAKSENGADNTCRFRASDGVWWDISDILNPIIAFNDDDLDGEINIPKSFGLYAWFDKNGSLRIDDLKAIENYEQASATDKINLENLYIYLAGEKITAESTLHIIGPYVSCDQYENCSAYDENGRQVGNICNESGTSCYVYYTYTQNGDKIIKTTGDDCTGSDIGSCPYKQYTTLDKKGREIGGGCDESGTSCSVYLTYIQKGDKTIKIQGSGSGCSESDISSCPNKSYSTLDEKGRQTGTGCNDSGTNCWAYSTYTKNGDKTIKTYGEQCTGSDISSCPNKRYSTFDEKGRMTGDYCNETGTECEATYTITEQ